MQINIGRAEVGDNHPTFIIAEIGINHNGNVDNAIEVIRQAVRAGCHAVKFQKRTPDICVPKYMQDRPRQTPWGAMTYLEYRKKVELYREDYTRIHNTCKELGIMWTASCWDTEALAYVMDYDPPFLKLASACITDYALVKAYAATGKPVIMSTGMSSHTEIKAALAWLTKEKTILLHCNSTYPAANSELNLKCIRTLRRRYETLVGYSGHERGITPSCIAVAMGACVVERHVTLDRTAYGSDQAASLEAPGLLRLCRDIRVTEASLGDGVKKVYDGEEEVKDKLRRC